MRAYRQVMENNEYIATNPEEIVEGISLPTCLARLFKQKMLLYSVSISTGSMRMKYFHTIKNNFEYYLLSKDSHFEHFEPMMLWRFQRFLAKHGLMEIPEYVRYLINSNSVQIDLTGDSLQRNTSPWHMQEIYIRIAQKCNLNLLCLKMKSKIAYDAKSYLFRNLANLRILELNDTHVTDFELATVGTVCTKLHKLTISNEPHVTNVGLRHIFDPRYGGSCSELRHVSFNGLEGISVEWCLVGMLSSLQHLTWLELDENSSNCSMDVVMFYVLLYGFKPLKLEHITLTDQHLADPRTVNIFNKVLTQIKCIKLIVVTPYPFIFPHVTSMNALTISLMTANHQVTNVIEQHSTTLESLIIQCVHVHASITFDILVFANLHNLQHFELTTSTEVVNMPLLDARVHFNKLQVLKLNIPNKDTKWMMQCIFLNPSLWELKLVNFQFDLVELTNLLANNNCMVTHLTLSQCALFNLLLARLVISLPKLRKLVVDLNHPYKNTLYKMTQVLGIQFDFI